MGAAGVASLGGALAAGCARQLTVLNLSDNDAAPSGASALAQALRCGGCPLLRALNLGSNGIGSASASDEGVCALADSLQACPRLARLDLHSNSIGWAGASALAAAIRGGSCRRMESLNLRATLVAAPEHGGDDEPASLFAARPRGPIALATRTEAETAAWRRAVEERREMGGDVGAGMSALVQALAGGGLPLLTELDIRTNLCGAAALRQLMEALEGGCCPRIRKVCAFANGGGRHCPPRDVQDAALRAQASGEAECRAAGHQPWEAAAGEGADCRCGKRGVVVVAAGAGVTRGVPKVVVQGPAGPSTNTCAASHTQVHCWDPIRGE
jgi:hypothetical protein